MATALTRSRSPPRSGGSRRTAGAAPAPARRRGPSPSGSRRGRGESSSRGRRRPRVARRRVVRMSTLSTRRDVLRSSSKSKPMPRLPRATEGRRRAGRSTTTLGTCLSAAPSVRQHERVLVAGRRARPPPAATSSSASRSSAIPRRGFLEGPAYPLLPRLLGEARLEQRRAATRCPGGGGSASAQLLGLGAILWSTGGSPVVDLARLTPDGVGPPPGRRPPGLTIGRARSPPGVRPPRTLRLVGPGLPGAPATRPPVVLPPSRSAGRGSRSRWSRS